MAMNTGQQVRFGLIGYGRIGHWHARNIRALPNLKLVGVADTDYRARKKAVKTFGVPAFATAEELLRPFDIDVVVICTPPNTHVPLIEAAAAAGKHVLVEKPLALNLAEAERGVAACAANNVQLGVVHQQRARSATRALRQLIINGRLGKPLLAVATHTWFKTQAEVDRHPWRGNAAAGGGVLLEQAVHAIDLLVWFLGEPRWVSGTAATLALKTSGEDTVVATIGFAGGAVATLAASTATNMMRDDIAIEVVGTRGGFRVEVRDYDNAEIVRLDLAEKDQARARTLSTGQIESLVQEQCGLWRRGPKSLLWRALARVAGKERGARPFRSPRAFLRRQIDRVAQFERQELQGHAAVLTQMAAAVRGTGEPLVTGRDALQSLAVIDGIYRSHATEGQRVNLLTLEGP